MRTREREGKETKGRVREKVGPTTRQDVRGTHHSAESEVLERAGQWTPREKEVEWTGGKGGKQNQRRAEEDRRMRKDGQNDGQGEAPVRGADPQCCRRQHRWAWIQTANVDMCIT